MMKWELLLLIRPVLVVHRAAMNELLKILHGIAPFITAPVM